MDFIHMSILFGRKVEIEFSVKKLGPNFLSKTFVHLNELQTSNFNTLLISNDADVIGNFFISLSQAYITAIM